MFRVTRLIGEREVRSSVGRRRYRARLQSRPVWTKLGEPLRAPSRKRSALPAVGRSGTRRGLQPRLGDKVPPDSKRPHYKRVYSPAAVPPALSPCAEWLNR